MDPKNAFAYNNRGIAYSDKGNLDQAMADYAKAIEMNSKYANAYCNRGLVYRQIGIKPQAVADLQMYLQFSPDASDRAQVQQ